MGDCELVGLRGQTAPLLELLDAPFNGVALLVRFGVDAGRAATGATSPRSWDVDLRALIPEGMPVLVGEDLRFEDGPAAARPTTVANR